MISLVCLFELKIYDKSSYHKDFGHIKIILDWLYKNRLLSKEGIEVYKLGVDQETSIHDKMLTPQGKQIMDKAYDKWLKKGKLDIREFEKLAR